MGGETERFRGRDTDRQGRRQTEREKERQIDKDNRRDSETHRDRKRPPVLSLVQLLYSSSFSFKKKKKLLINAHLHMQAQICNCKRALYGDNGICLQLQTRNVVLLRQNQLCRHKSASCSGNVSACYDPATSQFPSGIIRYYLVLHVILIKTINRYNKKYVKQKQQQQQKTRNV